MRAAEAALRVQEVQGAVADLQRLKADRADTVTTTQLQMRTQDTLEDASKAVQARSTPPLHTSLPFTCAEGRQVDVRSCERGKSGPAARPVCAMHMPAVQQGAALVRRAGLPDPACPPHEWQWAPSAPAHTASALLTMLHIAPASRCPPPWGAPSCSVDTASHTAARWRARQMSFPLLLQSPMLPELCGALSAAAVPARVLRRDRAGGGAGGGGGCAAAD